MVRNSGGRNELMCSNFGPFYIVKVQIPHFEINIIEKSVCDILHFNLLVLIDKYLKGAKITVVLMFRSKKCILLQCDCSV